MELKKLFNGIKNKISDYVSPNRKIYAVTGGKYLGQFFVYMEEHETHVTFLSIPSMEKIDVSKEKYNFAIEKIENSIESIERKNLKELYENRSKIYSEILELKSRIPTLNEKISALEIRSPIEGKVNTVFFNNKGAVIREGDILAEIVPTDSGLQIEAFIDPKDIGFIEPRQKVKISLTAYDASKYGYLSGELLQIAPDTIFREESNSSQYSVIVSIQSKILDNENSEADISPGMIAQVDIIRGRRSILEYFWQPVAKIKETTFNVI